MRNPEMEYEINGHPCLVVVTTDVRPTGIRGRDPDDDVIDPGEFEFEVYWPDGGRAHELERQITADGRDRLIQNYYRGV